MHWSDAMKLLIHGRNLEITSALRDYTRSKIERAIHHFEEMVQEADVHLSVARNPRVPLQTAEVTIFANGIVIRAQERGENLYASIDLVASKITRQLRRHKERHSNHIHKQASSSSQTKDTSSTELSIDHSLLEDKTVHLPAPGVRRKYFKMDPMTIDQARHQLDLIDHDFYLFRDQETKELQVIYKRTHGGYGVIQSRD